MILERPPVAHPSMAQRGGLVVREGRLSCFGPGWSYMGEVQGETTERAVTLYTVPKNWLASPYRGLGEVPDAVPIELSASASVLLLLRNLPIQDQGQQYLPVLHGLSWWVKRPVFPGDRLQVEATYKGGRTAGSALTGRASVEVWRGYEKIASGSITGGLVPLNALPVTSRQLGPAHDQDDWTFSPKPGRLVLGSTIGVPWRVPLTSGWAHHHFPGRSVVPLALLLNYSSQFVMNCMEKYMIQSMPACRLVCSPAHLYSLDGWKIRDFLTPGDRAAVMADFRYLTAFEADATVSILKYGRRIASGRVRVHRPY